MRSLVVLLTAASLTLASGCSKKPDVESVPVGSDVQLTRADGGVVEGKLAERDEKTVKVVTGKTTKTVPKDEIAVVQVVEPDKPAELPPVAKFREYVVPAETELTLTIGTPVSSETAKIEQAVEAALARAVRVDGAEVLPAGSAVRGDVSAVSAAGKVKGRASLSLHFTMLTAHDERYSISSRWAAEAESTKKEDAKKIGIGAGAGAIIGGILGGKKGAATGAAIGGGAGTAMVLTSEGKPIELGEGAEIKVKLTSDLTVKVPVR